MSESAGTTIKVACGHNKPRSCRPCFQTRLRTAVCSLQLNWHGSATDWQQSTQPGNSTLWHFVITSALPSRSCLHSPVHHSPLIAIHVQLRHLNLWLPFSFFIFFSTHCGAFVLSSTCIYKGILCQSPEAAKNKDSSLNQHTTEESWATPEPTTIALVHEHKTGWQLFKLHQVFVILKNKNNNSWIKIFGCSAHNVDLCCIAHCCGAD